MHSGPFQGLSTLTTFRNAGLHPLLSEEASIKDQVKAAKAAEFDAKVQSQLDDVDPEPEAAVIHTAGPSAPTAAKVQLFHAIRNWS